MKTPDPGSRVREHTLWLFAGLCRTAGVLLCASALPTFLPSSGHAETACPDDYRPAGRVTGVSGTELSIGDGLRLRLAAIDIGTGEAEDRERLEQVLRADAIGREARIALAKPETDRYGRLVGLVRLEEPGASSFENLQESLLRRGLAVARTEISFIACMPALLHAERPARAYNLGVWQRLPIPVWNVEALTARHGRFTIMAGRVRSVGNTRTIDYLNFGVKWREDATVRVGNGARNELRERGVALDAFTGRYVTIRGHVIEAGGPAIDVVWAEQIELPAAVRKDSVVSSAGLAAAASEAQEKDTIETAETSGAEQAGE